MNDWIAAVLTDNLDLGFFEFILAFGVIFFIIKTIHWQIYGKKIYNKLSEKKETHIEVVLGFSYW